MKPISILKIASLGAPPYLGGIENVVNTIINSDLSQSYKYNIFDTFRTQNNKRPIIKKLIFALTLFFRCGIMILKFKPKIVHIHFCSNVDFWKHSICLICSKMFGIKTVFQLHGGNFKKVYNQYNLFFKKMTNIIFNLSDINIVLSSYWENFLTNFVDYKKIRIINNPIDSAQFINLSCSKDFNNIPKILLLGRVGPHKGHFDVLEAIPSLIKEFSNIEFIFAGQEEYPGVTRELKNIAKTKKILDNVTFLGPVIGDDKIKLLIECSILILPSYGENMPISLLEGMASKTPIIASNVGAIPEMLENGNIGILIEPGDFISLSKSIQFLLKNQDVYRSFSRKGIKKIRNKYDVSIIIDKLANVYQELI